MCGVKLLRAGGLAILLSLTPACTEAQHAGRSDEAAAERATRASEIPNEAELVLQRELDRITVRAEEIDEVFLPLPLLRPAEESALRRFGNDQQLARARALGIGRGPSSERLASLEREGRLVRLEGSTPLWIVRRLDYSVPLLVPAAHSLLIEIGERFQTRLQELDVPPYRLEVTSLLRSAEDQAALRRVNPNAAAGESTHEFGTTLDIAYSAFAAPLEPIVPLETAEAPWLEPHLARFASAMAESVAARRSRELQAILGHVLLELQEEGRVMVTLERLQPVYHLTVAREQPAARGIAVGMASRVVRTGSSDDQKR
jgi:hypothetical protein